jgi:hypothetical protein
MTRDQLLLQQAQARVFQARYDSALEPYGQRAPEPTFGMDVNEYRRNMAAQTKKLLPDGHDLRKVRYWGLDDTAFEVFEPQLLRALPEHGRRNDTVPYDVPLHEVIERDANGLKMVKFIGQRSFVHDFKSIPRRAHIFDFQTHSFYPRPQIEYLGNNPHALFGNRDVRLRGWKVWNS